MVKGKKKIFEYLTLKKALILFPLSLFVALPFVLFQSDYRVFDELFGVTFSALPDKFSEMLKLFFPYFRVWILLVLIFFAAFSLSFIISLIDRDLKVGEFTVSEIGGRLNDNFFVCAVFAVFCVLFYAITRFLSVCILYYTVKVFPAEWGRFLGLFLYLLCYLFLVCVLTLMSGFLPNVADKGLRYSVAISESIISTKKYFVRSFLPFIILYFVKYLIYMAFSLLPPIVGLLYYWLFDGVLVLLYILGSYLNYYKYNGKKRADYRAKYPAIN